MYLFIVLRDNEIESTFLLSFQFSTSHYVAARWLLHATR